MKLARITEVGPRDGLQNESKTIPTPQKVRLVELLCAARPDEIEVTSFVSAKWIPQLSDASNVLAEVARFKPADVLFSVLTPNERGLLNALDTNARAGRRLIDKVSVFTAASETFSMRNTNATIAQTLARFVPVIERARREGLMTRGYISCVVACPFEGAISPQQVESVVRKLVDMGVEEIDLGETIGVAQPEQIAALLERVYAAAPAERLTLHLHDTSGRAADCVRTATRWGIRSFDGAVGGLGGCPYASTPEKRAPGNISTQALIEALRLEGLHTRVDENALRAAAEYALSISRQ